MLKKWKENKLVSEWNAFWRQEEGVGVIEIVLILVVLIGLVIIFKTRLRSFWRISLKRLRASLRKYINSETWKKQVEKNKIRAVRSPCLSV